MKLASINIQTAIHLFAVKKLNNVRKYIIIAINSGLFINSYVEEGDKEEKMKFCTKCGKSANDDALFCTACGAKFKTSQISEPSNMSSSFNEEKTKPAPPLQQQPEHVQQQVIPSQQQTLPPRQQTIPPQQQPRQFQQQMLPPSQTFGNEPKKKSRKGGIIALVSILSILLIAGLGVGGFFFYAHTKTEKFANYLENYKEKAAAYASLGDYSEEYNTYLSEAKKLISKKDFRSMPQQKSRMETLWPELDNMVSQIEKQKEIFDDIVAEMESDEKYFFGDMEHDYNAAKEAAEAAITNYLATDAVKKTKAFEKVADEIKEYDKNEVHDYLQDVEQVSRNSGWLALEENLLNTRKQQVIDSADEGNYVKTKEAYDAFMKQKSSLEAVNNAAHVLSGYNQADVSKDYEVRLYFDISEITDWEDDGFTIYEKANNNNDWKYCELLDVNEVDGHMTIDLVADVSDSMSSSFTTMQNILSSFASSTSPDTYLGLSLIGNVYERKLGFTQDKTTVSNEINHLNCYGLTSLYQSLYSSVMYTASASGAKCVVAFTDGMNVSYNTGFDYSADDVIRVAKAYQIPVYIIGLGSNIDSALLRRIATETGGQYYDRVSISDMSTIYGNIYSQQKNRYEVSYKSEFKSDMDRQIYMLYYDDNTNVGIRFENELAAATLYNGYQMAFDANNLAGYYTDKKYLSSDDLSHIANINDLQKLINIYCAKNGYQFQNPNVLQEMISMGVISSNGTLNMDSTTANLQQNSVLWANYMALYNRRYELIYQEVYKVYNDRNKNISLEEIMTTVHQNLGQTDLTRFSVDVNAAYKAVTTV